MSATKEETSGRAIASLVFGILGITGTCACIGSILAIVLGAGEEGGIARAGVLLGWIGLAIWGLAALVWSGFLLFAVLAEAL